MLKMILMASVFLLAACASSQDAKRAEDKSMTAANYNVQLGMGYLGRGNIERAKEKLLIAVHEAPTWPPALTSMGYFYEKTGDIENARKYYDRALSLDSSNGLVQNDYGTFLCRQGQYNAAEEHFLKAVGDHNYVSTADAYENAGICARQAKNDDKAVGYFKKALQQDPLRNNSLYSLAELYYQHANYKPANNYISMIPIGNLGPEGRRLRIRIQKKLLARGDE